jgi:hypothetical protein
MKIGRSPIVGQGPLLSAEMKMKEAKQKSIILPASQASSAVSALFLARRISLRFASLSRLVNSCIVYQGKSTVAAIVYLAEGALTAY